MQLKGLLWMFLVLSDRAWFGEGEGTESVRDGLEDRESGLGPEI